MRKTTLRITGLVMLAVMLMSFSPNPSTPERKNFSLTKKASIQWKSEQITLGDIPQNKPVEIHFEFTNNGEAPVVITSVQASCGCTAANYSKTPVLPGETTKITATFNAAAKGAFKKTITVITNAEETPKVLSFNGTVI